LSIFKIKKYITFALQIFFMKNLKYTLILLLTLSSLQSINADTIATAPEKPKFIYKIDNLTYFDNRTFYSPYNPNIMFFGNRLTAMVGIGVQKQYNLYAGVTAMIPFGTDFKDYKFQPMVYYRFQQDFACKKVDNSQNLTLNFGIFPYRTMLMTLPGIIRKGSIEYTIPNMQGALAQYQNNGEKTSFFFGICRRLAKNSN